MSEIINASECSEPNEHLNRAIDRHLRMQLQKYNESVRNMTLEQARDIVSGACAHSDMNCKFEKAVQMLLDCADREIKDKWTFIEKDEDLPEPFTEVLVAYEWKNYPDNIYKAFYDHDKSGWYLGEYSREAYLCGLQDVTAWRPLPKEPVREETTKARENPTEEIEK